MLFSRSSNRFSNEERTRILLSKTFRNIFIWGSVRIHKKPRISPSANHSYLISNLFTFLNINWEINRPSDAAVCHRPSTRTQFDWKSRRRKCTTISSNLFMKKMIKCEQNIDTSKLNPYQVIWAFLFEYHFGKSFFYSGVPSYNRNNFLFKMINDWFMIKGYFLKLFICIYQMTYFVLKFLQYFWDG